MGIFFSPGNITANMEMLYFHCFLMLITFAVIDSRICDPIRICPNFQQHRIFADYTSPNWKTEFDIARYRSWHGVIPESYDLEFIFHNSSHYSGSVEITINIIKEINQISINHGRFLEIDYSAITIKPLCRMKLEADEHDVGSRCIENATFLEAEETLILYLKGGQLIADTAYVLSLPSFEGSAIEGTFNATAERGLYRSTVRNDLEQFSATTTTFQMRYARTAFPCFDHPSLKACFNLCIDAPSNITVASNTQPQSLWVHPDRKRTCFARSPKMPTHLFSFALMENYTSESVGVSDLGISIEIFGPNGKMEELRWILNESIAVVRYFERITKFKFPLCRLGFVVAYPPPVAGVENFGLISLDGQRMGTEESYTLLYHELVHQWLGNVVTISEWREVCLQEGLASYFHWKISADRKNDSLAKIVERERAQFYGLQYEAFGKKNRQKKEMADCYDIPPLVFHTVTARYGFEAIERFLATLIKRHPFTANIDDWDDIMAEVTEGRTESIMKGYVKGWFLQPGPLYLLASKWPRGNGCIIIRQMVYNKSRATVARPVPVALHTYGQPPAIHQLHLNTIRSRICGLGNAGYMIDPDADAFTINTYTAENYLHVLKYHAANASRIPDKQIRNFVKDFCKSLMEGVLPLEEEPNHEGNGNWIEVYRMVNNLTQKYRRECGCCLNSKEENENSYGCAAKWKRFCRGIRLNRIIGRDYEMSETSAN